MRRSLLRLRDDDHGMTVVELSVASMLFVIVLFSVFSVLDSGTKAERGQQARHDSLLQARAAMTRMTRDVRQALSLSPSSTRTRLQIETYINGAAQQVVYELNASDQIVRTVGTAAGTTLVERVTTDAPFCYDPDSSCTAPAPAVTLSKVRINLSVQPDVANAREITLATDIELRNT